MIHRLLILTCVFQLSACGIASKSETAEISNGQDAGSPVEDADAGEADLSRKKGPKHTLTPTPTSNPTVLPTPIEPPVEIVSPTPIPEPTSTAMPSTLTRAPITTPLYNLGGHIAEQYLPTMKFGSLAVSPDGLRVAISWLHTDTATNFHTGEPTAYVIVGNPSIPSSFSAPTAVGKRPFDYAAGIIDEHKKYNTLHNEPLILPKRNGGFINFALPMNANGWAEMLLNPKPPYGYVTSQNEPNTSTWSTPALLGLSDVAAGSTVSYGNAAADLDGGYHLFGQGHLGAVQGGMGHQFLGPGSQKLVTKTLASVLWINGMTYDGEGFGHISPQRNALGKQDIHVAFAYNKMGGFPMYGLYYLVSQDGGQTWKNAQGQAVQIPLKYGAETAAAIVPAQLRTDGTYVGALHGRGRLAVASTPDGKPVIVRLNFINPADPLSKVQATIYTFHNGQWLKIPVGIPLRQDFHRPAVSVNSKTGRVNVLLTDAGGANVAGRVLLYHQSLADLRLGKSVWTEEVVATIPNGKSATSMLHVVDLPDSRFCMLAEPNHIWDSRGGFVYLEAPIR